MKNALIAAAVVYAVGAAVVRWKLDTSPDSDGKLTWLWPYYLATHPVDFTTGLKYAFTTRSQ